ncbi:hypothetical protein HDK77DRAFT_280704 [Phyllosticta capitalensis]
MQFCITFLVLAGLDSDFVVWHGRANEILRLLWSFKWFSPARLLCGRPAHHRGQPRHRSEHLRSFAVCRDRKWNLRLDSLPGTVELKAGSCLQVIVPGLLLLDSVGAWVVFIDEERGGLELGAQYK